MIKKLFICILMNYKKELQKNLNKKLKKDYLPQRAL